MTRLPRLGLPLPAPLAYAAAVLSGLLYWLAFPGVDAWPLAFIAWVPLILALHGQPARRAMLLGGAAGLTMNVAGFLWLQQMLETFSGFPAPVCFLFLVLVCAYQGGRIALLGWLYGRATARNWPAPFVFAAAFAASELVYPLLFPWYYSATVHQVPVLMQLADIGGPIAVGLVLVAVNLAVAELVLARLQSRRLVRATFAGGGGTVGLACVYGALRIPAVETAMNAAPASTVGIVQADMGLMEKRTQFGEGLRRHLDMSHALRAQGVDFLVWSETAATRPVNDETYREELRSVASAIGLPTIFGAVIVKRVPDERRYVLYNSAVSSESDGTIVGRYDKQYLLTFGEYLPFGDRFPILYKWSPNSGHFTPGNSLEPLAIDANGESHRVTALVCYEDILPRFTSAALRHGESELFVNITNDAWFGDTAEPWQHLALAQLRAVEHRRYLVRGTNSGVSAVVDPVGRVTVHSGTFRQETLVAPIRWMRSLTLYEVAGDWPWVLVSAAAFGAAFRQRRPAKASSPS
ncbi:MAG TPA: apolipoprotein N-acyltransferase [Polyangiaceae bacterium]|nr:apolipoprotein N-acyltransferase [Polyangiaceae bacterium]